MEKHKAIRMADQFKAETGQDAFVIDFGGTFDWFSESYFDNGFDGGYVVYGTVKGQFKP